MPWCPLTLIPTLPSSLPWTLTLMMNLEQHAETTVGSNPGGGGGGRVTPNIPNPPLCLLVVVLCLLAVVSIGRTYLKVHGGRAPRHASTSSRVVANRGGDGAGAGQQRINSYCSWLAAVVGLLLPAMHPG